MSREDPLCCTAGPCAPGASRHRPLFLASAARLQESVQAIAAAAAGPKSPPQPKDSVGSIVPEDQVFDGVGLQRNEVRGAPPPGRSQPRER